MKNSKTYTISVIGAPNPIGPMFTFKSLGESENGHTNPVTENNSQLKKSTSEIDDVDGSDFETAIKATGYGKFNWLLMFFIAWGFMSAMNATTKISLVLPSAECDLNLSNFNKGMLNSVVYTGMTISAFSWGIVSDALGRRSVLVLIMALDTFFSILVGLAQNFTFLIIIQLLSGFISAGPFSIMTTYLAESHSNVYRGSITIFSGVFTSVAWIMLPLLAWLIIPRDIGIVLFNGYISLTSWRIFLLVSSIPSFVALIGFLLLDESPKFLMFQGNNKEALRVMQKIYKMNTGKPKDTFPIKRLRNEMGSDQKDLRKRGFSVKQLIITSWKQMVPIFHKPYLLTAILTCLIQFFIFCGMNTIRLWSPQLFASAMEYEKYGSNSTMPSTVCELLSTLSKSGTEESVDDVAHCNANPVEDRVYFNSMITGLVVGIGYLISGYVVKFLDRKWLMISSLLLCFACCFGLYWSSTSDILLGVVSLFIAFTSAASTALSSAVVDIFPTSLRTTAISLCMTFGRLGAVIGNLTFPLLLDVNCTFPFILMAVLILAGATLTMFLPITKGKDLE